MTTSRATLRNWRDADSYIGHDNAIVCAIFSPPKEGETPDPHQCLQHMNGFARHNLQGGKDGDRHAHTHAEQYYYILSGEADVDIGDDTYPVREGTVCYFPPDVEHQLRAADRTEWVEYLIITSGTEDSGSKPYVTNWRGSTPATGSHGFGLPDPSLDFDINTFAIQQVARYFQTHGQVLSDDPCMEDHSCDWLRPFDSEEGR